MNAANEIAVAAFLDGRLPYLGIAEVVEAAMDEHRTMGVEAVESIPQLLDVDTWARAFAEAYIESRGE
jgi:1-deoxy-D-xylulose-5-phosphate reductoisomerase